MRKRVRAGAGLSLAVLASVPPGVDGRQGVPVSTTLESGTDALLQAVSAVDGRTVWVGGHRGTVLVTRDGGETWVPRPIPGADSLEFRDVHGFDARRALVLSAGEGELSRIYTTDDGGETWSLRWMNTEPAGFYDCVDFWDDRRGVAYGDAVGGALRILLTGDGGRTWERAPEEGLPAALDGEGGFAASGTCVDAGVGGRAWIGTGAGTRPRIMATSDHGRTWRAADLPLVTGPAAGAFTVVFRDATNGVVLGGDLERPEADIPRVALTGDGGETWRVVPGPPFSGTVYGAARVEGSGVLLAAGPGGLAMTDDGIGRWHPLDDRSFWAVAAADDAAWAVGPEGRILRLDWGSADPP